MPFVCIVFTSKKEINNIKRWFWLVTIDSLLFNERRISLPADQQVMSGDKDLYSRLSIVFIGCSKVTFHSEPVKNYYSLIKKTIKAWNIQTIKFILLSFTLLSSVISSSVTHSWSLSITLHLEILSMVV
jgi:vancomycin permeability regulator SanA